MNTSHHVLGVFLILLVFLFTAIINTIGKIAIETLPVGLLLFTQNLIALLVVIPIAAKSKFQILHTTNLSIHFLRAITGLLSYACLFIAVKYISLVNATLLANSAPLFLPFVAMAINKEKIRLKIWVSILIGFIGVYFILSPSGHSLKNVMVIVALMGSLFSAIALQSIRILKTSESVISIIFYYFMIASVAMLPFLYIDRTELKLMNYALLIPMGVLLPFTQLLLAKAYQYATPTLLGPFNYSVVVFAGLIQWWLWGTIPSPLGFLGIVLVSLGGILTLVGKRSDNA